MPSFSKVLATAPVMHRSLPTSARLTCVAGIHPLATAGVGDDRDVAVGGKGVAEGRGVAVNTEAGCEVSVATEKDA